MPLATTQITPTTTARTRFNLRSTHTAATNHPLFEKATLVHSPFPDPNLAEHLARLSDESRAACAALLQSIAAMDKARQAQILQQWLAEAGSAATAPAPTTPHAETVTQAGDEPRHHQVTILKQGDVCGVFRIERLLGKGGAGHVFLARRTDDLQLKVALKTLTHFNDTRIERFRRECRILANLKHPNIAHLIDAGALPSGQPWLAMEYVEGQTLDRYLTHKAQTLPERLRLFLKICSAVAHAHQHMIVHRDLKPGNILVQANGEPKLLDFGIAVVQADTQPHQGEEIVLTPGYASPEQIQGKRLTAASDIYSLGVVFYEVLTGQRPYQVDTINNTELAALFQTMTITKPSRRTRGRLVNEAPATRWSLSDLDYIALKALALRPEDRYQNMEALMSDVRAYLRGLPIKARPNKPWYVLRKFLGRHPIPTGLVTVALATLLFFNQHLQHQRRLLEQEKQTSEQVTRFLISMFQQIDPDVTKDADISAFDMVENGRRAMPQMLEGADDVQVHLLHSLGQVYAGLGKSATSVDLLEQALAKMPAGDVRALEIELDILASEIEAGEAQAAQDRLAKFRAKLPETVTPRVAARLTFLEMCHAYQLGRYVATLKLISDLNDHHQHLDLAEQFQLLKFTALAKKAMGETEEAQKGLEQLLALQREKLGLVHSLVAWTLLDLGSFETEQRRFDEAKPRFDQAEAVFSQLYHENHTVFVRCKLRRAVWLRDQGRYDEAETLIQKASTEVLKNYGKYHLLFAHTRNHLGMVYQRSGKLQQAEQAYREALALNQNTLGEEHLQTITTRNNLGVLFNTQGRFVEAADFHRQTLALHRQINGPRHPQVALDLNNLGTALGALGRHKEAEALLREALSIYRDVYGPRHPQVGLLLNNLGHLHYTLSELEAAEKAFREAIEIRRDHFGQEHSYTVQSLNNLALVLESHGKLEEAEAILRQVVQAWTKEHGENHHYTAVGLGNLANIRCQRGAYREAEEWYQRSLAVRRAIYPNPSTGLAHGQMKVGKIWTLLGRTEEALALLNEAETAMAEAYQPNHQNLVRVRNEKAACLLELGRAQEAASLLQQSLAAGASLGAQHQYILEAQRLLVESSLHQAQTTTATQLLETLSHNAAGGDHPLFETARRHTQANLAAAVGQADTGAWFERALAAGHQVWSTPHPVLGRIEVDYALYLIHAGTPKDALPHLTAATAHLAELPPNHRYRTAHDLLYQALDPEAAKETNPTGGSLHDLRVHLGDGHFWVHRLEQTLQDIDALRAKQAL